MRVMVLVKATEDSEARTPPAPGAWAAMERFNADLVEAGILVTADGLKPSADGVRIVFDGTDRTLIAGPFPAVHELVAGFWIWQVEDMAEAIAWAKRCPNPMPGPSEIELRPFYEAEDVQALLRQSEA